MKWLKRFFYQPLYKYTGTNQYGDRFKRSGDKKLSIARIQCDYNDADGLLKLALLSHTLDTPVRYDFESSPQQAYIDVISLEQLQK